MDGLVWIELTAHERVVARGTERVTWWVHMGEVWIPVRNHPEVILEMRSPAPRVVWETSARLPVERGTWLLRSSRSPLAEPARDPMHYLGRQALSARLRYDRRYFRVGPRGELLRAARDASPPPFETVEE